MQANVKADTRWEKMVARARVEAMGMGNRHQTGIFSRIVNGWIRGHR
jgi:hypothetical protein